MSYVSNELAAVVQSFLSTKPDLADNPTQLILNVINYYQRKQVSDHEAKEITRSLKTLGYLELPAFESISRCSRKLQEENPELRGKKYEVRKQKAQRVREEMR